MSLFRREASWFSIPAGRPFLRDLAAELYKTLGPDGENSLTDSLILLPNRRGARALAEAFLESSGRRALLLPQVRALGDLDENESPFEAGDLAADLPPAISPWRRRLELIALVQDYLPTMRAGLDAQASLEFADALGAFFDSLEIEEVENRDQIANLVDGDLAEHWRESAAFLSLAIAAWPERLKALGLCDPATRRVTLLRRLAEKWESSPPTFPVIAAGSTGSVKATAALLAAVARAPRGCVVLPGLDQNLADDAWAQIEPQHPQHALKRLLDVARIARGDVDPWPASDSLKARWRRRVINEALRPAEATGDWRGQIEALNEEARKDGVPAIATGLSGLHVLSCADEEDAAAAVAVLLRESLEEGKTAALVTPDQAFSRRVSARLARWGVSADSSGGAPLADCPTGVLLGLLARLAAEPDNPVTLLAVLKHPLVRLGLTPEALITGREGLERYGLRGRRPRGADEVYARLAEVSQPDDFARRVYDLTGPVRATFAEGELPLGEAARQIAQAAESLAAGPGGGTGGLWAGPGGEAAAGLLAALMEDGDLVGPVGEGRFLRLFDRLLETESVRASAPAHPRLQILGALEARLVHADRIVLAGLEEGMWPPNAPTDPFLSRPMRKTLGLPSPERRIGLSAHDFAQAACAPEVTLVHSERRGGQPSVKSRWLWRLETLARGADLALPERSQVIEWARMLDAPAG
ncbi:MAG: double-strand break repair protein AddB, partial [Alphaproteobacteria bacterium]